MLSDSLKNYKIILASGSPRRQQFFKEMNLDFEIRLKEIEEIYPGNLQGVEITNYLAILKSQAFEKELEPNDILITSDTIVWLNGKALGKPMDYNDAVQILKSLSNPKIKYNVKMCLTKTETKNQSCYFCTLTF